jgi:drug/metabolite transporter (DMT)-like permease
MMLTAITTFGVARFGAKALAESTSMLAPGRRARWVVLGCGLLVIAWLSVQDAPDFLLPFEWSVTGLAVASAVLTADYVAVATRVENVRRVDWTATIALLAGWTATLYMPKWIAGTDADQWWHPRLLPSYAVGFLVCLLGRIIQKQFPKAA